MKKYGKKYNKAKSNIPTSKQNKVEAIRHCKENSTAKFDESVDVAFSLCGSGEPDSKLIAFLIKYEAGAVLVTNVNELSSYIVISTGTVSPWRLAVSLLNACTKSIILTPYWPRAEPTGGAGVAPPPGICNLSIALIGFAIIFPNFLLYL